MQDEEGEVKVGRAHEAARLEGLLASSTQRPRWDPGAIVPSAEQKGRLIFRRVTGWGLCGSACRCP